MAKQKTDLSLQSFDEGLQSVEAVASPSDGIDVVGHQIVHCVSQVIAGVHCSTHTQLEQLQSLAQRLPWSKKHSSGRCMGIQNGLLERTLPFCSDSAKSTAQMQQLKSKQCIELGRLGLNQAYFYAHAVSMP